MPPPSWATPGRPPPSPTSSSPPGGGRNRRGWREKPARGRSCDPRRITRSPAIRLLRRKPGSTGAGRDGTSGRRRGPRAPASTRRCSSLRHRPAARRPGRPPPAPRATRAQLGALDFALQTIRKPSDGGLAGCLADWLAGGLVGGPEGWRAGRLEGWRAGGRNGTCGGGYNSAREPLSPATPGSFSRHPGEFLPPPRGVSPASRVSRRRPRSVGRRRRGCGRRRPGRCDAPAASTSTG
jgi:hypothetical protein